ncbi:hypothetical protein FGO68_gene3343 [Halteria grandinella]|uniref:Uncharacterized protein n=1 Tax=Halteria grandinella TaxID=5974 RepID=A0A8J8P8V5_HALGN|nr:hypothetical protein FGO68_gene3343 [Halteria grandinella]
MLYNTLSIPGGYAQQYSDVEEGENESETMALHYSERGSQGNRINMLQHELGKSQSSALALRNQQKLDESRESMERVRTSGGRAQPRPKRILGV